MAYYDLNFNWINPIPIDEYEIFKPVTNIIVKDVVSYYLVSNYGRVFNCRSGKFLTQTPDKDGYLRVGLLQYPQKDSNKRVDIKTVKVHRLVMFAFGYIDGIENTNMVVNHINNIKTDNYVLKSVDDKSPFLETNLEWTTAQDNSHHARKIGAYDFMVGSNNINAKLNPEKVKEIKRLAATNKYTNIEIGKMFNVTSSTIGDILKGKLWKDI